MINHRQQIGIIAAGMLAAALCVSAPISPARAFGVSPTHIEMTTIGRSGRGQIQVMNELASPLPVEAIMKRFELNEDGKGRTTRGDVDDILVFPPQAFIPPNSTQVFRLQWVGEPMLAKSRSYLLSVSQIPVKMPKGRSGVQIALSLGVVINVAPPRGTPQLKIVNAAVARDQSGSRVPVITVFNPSNVHALLPESTIRLASGKWGINLSPRELSHRIGIGLVQPGQKRRFLLPVKLPPSVNSYRADLAFTPQKRR